MKINKYNQEGYNDPTPYEAIMGMTNKKDPKRQLQGAQSRAVGQCFEEMIDAACTHFENQQRAVIEKTPEPMRIIKGMGKGKFMACFTKSAQPDYKGTLANGQAIVFEAKHTGSEKIEQNRVSPEQSDKLEKHNQLGAVTFILVSINLENYYRVPWITWRNMKEIYGHKYMSTKDLEPYKIKLSNGVIQFL